MAITPLKAFLFAVGGSVAAAGVAYVSGALDPYLNTPPADVASLSQSATSGQAPAATTGNASAMAPAAEAMKPATEAMKPAAPAGEAASTTQPAPAGVVAPTFDVVRVEDNGSVVVAGNAAPNAKVEIIHGSTVLGETTAGADGAFAIVLDDPLKPGDYQIVLRSTAPDSVVATSTQTAVVSVPEQPGGQVLAMVEEPGKPAELLTVPKSVQQLPATAQATPGATEAPIKIAPAAPATDTTATPPANAAAEPKIVVEAVEIDGSKVFVAGLADAGRKVRAYANEILLGDAVTSPDGHFLIEAARDLPVGEYTIRVDGLDADGAKVVARATVPFQREPGESIAAVAPAAPVPAEQKPADTAAAAGTTEPAATDEQKPADTAAAANAPAEAPATTVAPKLEHVDSAVIIRRGDTLWRISRRVYGHGVRYSTIYLANQEQIADPDRIWPGQVFKVPEKSSEGETADYKAMGDQITSTPAKQ